MEIETNWVRINKGELTHEIIERIVPRQEMGVTIDVGVPDTSIGKLPRHNIVIVILRLGSSGEPHVNIRRRKESVKVNVMGQIGYCRFRPAGAVDEHV